MVRRWSAPQPVFVTVKDWVNSARPFLVKVTAAALPVTFTVFELAGQLCKISSDVSNTPASPKSSAKIIQPLFQSVEHTGGVVIVDAPQTEMRMPRVTASLRANASEDISWLLCAEIWLFLMMFVKAGIATPMRMESTATVIISSISVKPRTLRVFTEVL
jgi:hypothetical protein